jgi:hypothetical protein
VILIIPIIVVDFLHEITAGSGFSDLSRANNESHLAVLEMIQ